MKLMNKVCYGAIFLLLLIQPKSLLGQNKIDQARTSLKSNTTSRSVSSDTNSIILELLQETFLVLTYYSFIGDLETEGHFDNSVTPYPYHLWL